MFSMSLQGVIWPTDFGNIITVDCEFNELAVLVSLRSSCGHGCDADLPFEFSTKHVLWTSRKSGVQ